MATSMDTGVSESQGPTTDSTTLQYSMILEHLVGDKRPIKDLSPGVMGGLPVPPKSDEQKMIERGMESCAFKSVLACVGGEKLHEHYIIVFDPPSASVFNMWYHCTRMWARITCVRSCGEGTGIEWPFQRGALIVNESVKRWSIGISNMCISQLRKGATVISWVRGLTEKM